MYPRSRITECRVPVHWCSVSCYMTQIDAILAEDVATRVEHGHAKPVTACPPRRNCLRQSPQLFLLHMHFCILPASSDRPQKLKRLADFLQFVLGIWCHVSFAGRPRLPSVFQGASVIHSVGDSVKNVIVCKLYAWLVSFFSAGLWLVNNYEIIIW